MGHSQRQQWPPLLPRPLPGHTKALGEAPGRVLKDLPQGSPFLSPSSPAALGSGLGWAGSTGGALCALRRPGLGLPEAAFRTMATGTVEGLGEPGGFV